jgi:catechol 2,3-dioxygenase-like lactoylglutathione lyase family enzyme
MLNHIAIPISHPDEIKNFYIGILGFEEQYNFEIEEKDAFSIFSLNRRILVSVIEKGGFKLELFHSAGPIVQGFGHICLERSDVEEVCRLAADAGYKVVRVDRPSGLLAFITDKTGNLFEMKAL